MNDSGGRMSIDFYGSKKNNRTSSEVVACDTHSNLKAIMFEAKKSLSSSQKYSRTTANYRLTPSMSSSLPNSHADEGIKWPSGQQNRGYSSMPPKASDVIEDSEIMFSPNRSSNSPWFSSFNQTSSSKTSPYKNSSSKDNGRRGAVDRLVGPLNNESSVAKQVTSKYFPVVVPGTTTSPRKRISREVPPLMFKRKLSLTGDSKPVTIIDSSPSPSPSETTPTSAPPTTQAAIAVEVSFTTTSTASSSHSSAQSRQEFNDTNLGFPSESVSFQATPPQSKVSAATANTTVDTRHTLPDHSYHQQTPPPGGDSQMSSIVDHQPVQQISIEDDVSREGQSELSGKDQTKSPQKCAAPSKLNQLQFSSGKEFPQLSKEDFHFTMPIGGSSGSAPIAGGGGGAGGSRKRKHSSGDEVIFQGEELSAPKQYPTRARKAPLTYSSANSIPQQSLQRKPLGSLHMRSTLFNKPSSLSTESNQISQSGSSSQRHSLHKQHSPPRQSTLPKQTTAPMAYKEILETAKSNVKGGKQDSRMVSKDVLVMSKPPVLKGKRSGDMSSGHDVVKVNLESCQIGRLVVKKNTALTSPALELHKEKGLMKLNLEYCGKKGMVEIPYKEIEKCECFNLRTILLKLREGLVRKISSVLSQKFNLNLAFFKYSKLVGEESVVILFGKQRQPKLDHLISSLKSKLFTSLGCEVCDDIGLEEMDAKVAKAWPTSDPDKKQYSFRKNSDSPIGDVESLTTPTATTTSGNTTKRFYGSANISDDNADFLDPPYYPSRTKKRPPASSRSPSIESSSVVDSERQQLDDAMTTGEGSLGGEVVIAPPRRTLRMSTRQRRSGRQLVLQQRRTGVGPNVKVLLYKPKGCKDGVELMSDDVECLFPGEYLNDKIMDFYLKYMMYEMLDESLQSKLHIFNSFFYTRLNSVFNNEENLSTPKKYHNRVKTWTRHVDLFEKEYVVIPICDKSHWFAVLVCHPGKFDPSKAIIPPVKKRRKPLITNYSRRRKLTRRNRKTIEETPGGTVLLDSSQHFFSKEAAGPEKKEGESKEDPLSDHVPAMGGDAGKSEALPGAKLAAAQSNSLAQLAESYKGSGESDIEEPGPLPSGPPSSFCYLMSPPTQKGADPGVGMWEGVVREEVVNSSGRGAGQGGGAGDEAKLTAEDSRGLEGRPKEKQQVQPDFIPLSEDSLDSADDTQPQVEFTIESVTGSDSVPATSDPSIKENSVEPHASENSEGREKRQNSAVEEEAEITVIPNTQVEVSECLEDSQEEVSEIQGEGDMTSDSDGSGVLDKEEESGCQGEGEEMESVVEEGEGEEMESVSVGEGNEMEVGEEETAKEEGVKELVNVEEVREEKKSHVSGEVKEDWEKVTVKKEKEEKCPESCILVLDSLSIKRSRDVNRIRSYLTEEWKVKKPGEEKKFDHIPLKYPKIPLQDNFSDCGIFLLQYIETLVMCLKENHPLPDSEDGWGRYPDISRKRVQIKELITKKEQEAKTTST